MTTIPGPDDATVEKCLILGHGFHATSETLESYDANDATEWFDNDCIHPNDRGHHELRRLFEG